MCLSRNHHGNREETEKAVYRENSVFHHVSKQQEIFSGLEEEDSVWLLSKL
jgi:hypothetical protein